MSTVAMESEKECAICMEELKTGEQETKLPCKHLFHGACVYKWLKKHSTCPLCRFQVWGSTTEVESDEEYSLEDDDVDFDWSVDGDSQIEDWDFLEDEEELQYAQQVLQEEGWDLGDEEEWYIYVNVRLDYSVFDTDEDQSDTELDDFDFVAQGSF